MWDRQTQENQRDKKGKGCVLDMGRKVITDWGCQE